MQTIYEEFDAQIAYIHEATTDTLIVNTAHFPHATSPADPKDHTS